ncbi:unnamed protein product, partial [Mesorhabditis belari]|uniref:SCP domain-containing protein n=1 Tax=Mesorhabditis belari TaxID=2138241 RepID=A0AAF3FJ58_9BILA
MKFTLLCALFGGISAVVLPGAEITGLVNAHNSFRSQLALGTYKAKDGTPFASATNMLLIQWNSTLATSASNYAATCSFLTHSGTSGVGENLYITTSSVITGIGAASSNSWANEFYNFGPKGYVYWSSGNNSTGHATQMAWATTGTVGCGYATCSNGPTGWTSYTIVVCQYYQQGNWGGQQAYAQGTTCSQCPSGTTCQTSTGLCASGSGATTTPSSITTVKTTTAQGAGTPCQQCARNVDTLNEQYYPNLGTVSFTYRTDPANGNCLIADWYCKVDAPYQTAGFQLYTGGPSYMTQVLDYNNIVGITYLGANDTTANGKYKPFVCNSASQWSFNGVSDLVLDCFAYS